MVMVVVMLSLEEEVMLDEAVEEVRKGDTRDAQLELHFNDAD